MFAAISRAIVAIIAPVETGINTLQFTHLMA